MSDAQPLDAARTRTAAVAAGAAGTRAARIHLALLLSAAALLVWSGINPRGRFVWVLEVTPAVVGALIFLAVYRRFRFTTLTYVGAWFFSLILIVGGHYTYAEVPLGFWLRDTFDFARNPYDRVGHFFQGFVPALIARELILRTSPLRPGKWLFTFVTALCLAISALYELVEWFTAVVSADGSVAFLGMQGDVWDAQWDMFLALCGAITAQLLLARIQDRQMTQLPR